MVRLPALITEYSRLDGRPRSTIAWYARLAREAGKLPTSKRGRGASEMGVREAVNLILACNGAEDPKEGAEAVDRIRSYKGSKIDNFECLENDEMRKIGLKLTFGEALEELIRLTPDLFKTFDEELNITDPKLSVKDRFHIIKRFRCTFIGEDIALISLGIESFLGRGKDRFKKNTLEYDFYEESKFSNLTKKITSDNLRETDVSLYFGVFMGLANLLLEDSMRFPDELIPQSKGGGGDG